MSELKHTVPSEKIEGSGRKRKKLATSPESQASPSSGEKKKSNQVQKIGKDESINTAEDKPLKLSHRLFSMPTSGKKKKSKNSHSSSHSKNRKSATSSNLKKDNSPTQRNAKAKMTSNKDNRSFGKKSDSTSKAKKKPIKKARKLVKDNVEEPVYRGSIAFKVLHKLGKLGDDLKIEDDPNDDEKQDEVETKEGLAEENLEKDEPGQEQKSSSRMFSDISSERRMTVIPIAPETRICIFPAVFPQESTVVGVKRNLVKIIGGPHKDKEGFIRSTVDGRWSVIEAVDGGMMTVNNSYLKPKTLEEDDTKKVSKPTTSSSKVTTSVKKIVVSKSKTSSKHHKTNSSKEKKDIPAPKTNKKEKKKEKKAKSSIRKSK